VPITAEFFHRKSNPGKIVGISDFVAGNPEISSRGATLRPQPVWSRSVVAPATPRSPGAMRRAEPGAQGQCEKCCSAGVLRRDGGAAGMAASALPFAAPPQHDGNWSDSAGGYPDPYLGRPEIAADTIIRRGKPYLIV
jgi:hypothetical protein